MSTMITAQLKEGRIFGDLITQEYVYLPAGEWGMSPPLLIYETAGNRTDISLEDALHLIESRSLRLVRHPQLGHSCC